MFQCIRGNEKPTKLRKLVRKLKIVYLHCRKLIIFTGMSLSRVWKLYQRKEEGLLIVIVVFISWIVLGIIIKSKKKKKKME